MHLLASVALMASLVACAVESADTLRDCGLPSDARLAFAGEASLAELGIEPLDDRPGYVVVTADRVSAPQTASGRTMPGGPSRFACIVWPDGNGINAIPDDWSPPS